MMGNQIKWGGDYSTSKDSKNFTAFCSGAQFSNDVMRKSFQCFFRGVIILVCERSTNNEQTSVRT